MKKAKSVREILEKLHCKAYEGSNSEDDVQEALSAIRELLHKEMPEKRSKEEKNLWDEPISPIWLEGFNQAISQCHSAIDRVMGKE